MKQVSRREFLRYAGIGSAGLVLAACGTTPAPETIIQTQEVEKVITATPPVVAKFPGTKLSMKLRSSFIPQVNEVLRAEVEAWGKQTGVEVEVDIVGMNDIQTITATAAETGAGPDIVELNQSSAHTFAEALVDVSDVAQDLGNRYGGWYDSAKEACQVGGTWMALPRYYASHAINYRTDVFEKIGASVPKTWEELYEIGKELKAAGLPQVAFPLGHAVGDGNDFNYSVLWSYGASDIAADGKTVAIDSAETRQALAFMKKLFDETMPPDTLSYDDGSNNRSFYAGTIGVTNNAASIYINARNQNLTLEVDGEQKNVADIMDHFAYPAGPAGAVTYAEFMSMGIFGYSKNVDAAKALIQYLNEKDQLAPYAMPAYSFVFPALKDYKDMSIMPWNSNPKIAAFRDYAEQSHLPGYPSANFMGGNDAYANWVVVDMFASVAGGTATIDQAIATAKALLEQSYG
jgi:multiple sugar transport system substrate-binding protein